MRIEVITKDKDGNKAKGNYDPSTFLTSTEFLMEALVADINSGKQILIRPYNG